uniref:Uncharacterized protein n=1 Tax=Panagrellus redivivus TaxID=6233 RepID=A0A7E4VMG6_PANRE
MNNVAEVDLDKHPNRTRVWVVMELAGDVKFMPPEYEWVYINVEDEPCSEVKIKVVEGYAELLFKRTHTAFPAESYEDILFSSSTTSDTASTASITLQSEIDKDSNKKEVQNEPIITGLVCAAISILVLIFTALLSFVGCRLGRWHARKEALKKGLIKVEETVASTTPDNVENKTTEPAVTSVSTNVRRAIPSPNMASENASMPKVKDPKTPTTEKDSSALSKKSDNFA